MFGKRRAAALWLTDWRVSRRYLRRETRSQLNTAACQCSIYDQNTLYFISKGAIKRYALEVNKKKKVYMSFNHILEMTVWNILDILLFSVCCVWLVIKIRTQVVSSQAHTNIQIVANVFTCFLFLIFMTFLIWHIRCSRWCLDHFGSHVQKYALVKFRFRTPQKWKVLHDVGVFVLLTEHIYSSVPLGVRRWGTPCVCAASCVNLGIPSGACA